MENMTIPSCYYPTTVVLVDDNHKYLHSLHLELDYMTASYKLFNVSLNALSYLKDEYQPNPFISHYLQEDVAHDHRVLDVNVRALHHEIYNVKRFTEIGALVVDFVMPGVNGLELCQQLTDKSFKRILLTGEDQEKKAIQGFNNGDIHQYIRKDALNFSETMNATIRRVQWQYFLEQSSLLLKTIAGNSQLKLLSNPEFIQLFNSLRKKTNTIEFYLLDKHGSFLFLDRKANPSWLIVKSDSEIEKLYQYAVDEEAPAEVINALKERKMMPYFHTDTDMQTPPTGWQRYLLPVQQLSADQLYHYAFIQHQNLFGLITANILPYENYLETL